LNLKQIEMVGFKSFADPVKIPFQEGVTAIVGPNGCGKSNVADAVKWVLGEQSSKNLRGTNMQDVIFKGTIKRKSLSFCEVSLTFDNSNKIFNVPYDELTITRKLYRNGNSEYLINGNIARLKEITEILRESGLGKSGYSIISQGMVNKIVLAKPEDRRLIFEDAAGISKFKVKKQEAERRLDNTKDNLNQIGLIISEIDRQLGPLKKQSENAKIWLDLKEKLKHLEINEYIYKYDNSSENKEIINSKIAGITEELNFKQADLDKSIESYNTAFDEFNTLDIQTKELHNEELDLSIALTKLTGESDLVREKLNNLLTEEQRLDTNIAELKNQIEEFLNSLNDTNAKYTEKQAELDELKAVALDLNQKYDSISKEVESGENEVMETQKKLFDSLSKLGDVKAQIGALNAEKNTYTENLEQYNINLENLTKSFNNYKSSEEKSEDVLKDLNAKKDKLDIELKSNIDKQNSLLGFIKGYETEINEISSNVYSMEHRRNMLIEMQKEMEGFNGSVRRLLGDAERNNELKRRIVGVLASLIQVPQSYQTAIEMALGNAVQNVVTESDENAKYLINYLKQKEYGRITFLPINSIKPRYFDNSYKYLLNENGCFGLASSLVKYDTKLSNIMSSLLGTTLVVNNIDNAVALAKKCNYTFRIVTLEGDIIAPSGSITGGSKKAQVANLLSRQTDIENLKSQIDNLLLKKEEKQTKLSNISSEYNEITNLINVSTEELHNLEIEIAKEMEIYNKYVSNSSELEDQINKTNGSIARTTQILASIDDKLKEISTIDNSIDTNETGFNTNYSQFNDLKVKREEYSIKLTQTKVKIATLESEVISLSQDVQRINTQLEYAKSSLSSLEEQKEQNSKSLENYRSSMNSSADATNITATKMRLTATKAKIAELESKKSNNQTILRELEEKKMLLVTEVNRLQDKKNVQEQNLIKIDSELETLQEKVWDEYELTYDSALAYKQEMFDLRVGMQEIARIKKEINALGNINVNAIEDYKVLEARHGDLYAQAQDLLKAEEDIKTVIKELSTEMAERFGTEFNKINENFNIVFRELFGGGSATLVLTDPNDLLNSGVEIKAEPPEKKLNNTSLLSGGEQALVAISILFAILRTRPIPFCLLDEVEAPLDDANVFRFVQYLKRYSHETQFVVITHKKPTMENSDVLFGITMEEKGVSKVVSVKLSDAFKMAEDNK